MTKPAAGGNAPAMPSPNAAAAVGSASVGAATPQCPSPIPALFEEWKAMRDVLSTVPGDDDPAAEALMSEMDAIELRIRESPAQNTSDVAVKIAMWFETGQPIGWELVEQMEGGAMMLFAAYQDAKRLGGAA
ncbi:MAG: hypothetical protein ACM33T_10145 [Solirubrobacterales bacterium]